MAAQNRVVLVVDDDEAIRNFISSVLEAEELFGCYRRCYAKDRWARTRRSVAVELLPRRTYRLHEWTLALDDGDCTFGLRASIPEEAVLSGHTLADGSKAASGIFGAPNLTGGHRFPFRCLLSRRACLSIPGTQATPIFEFRAESEQLPPSLV